jgi:uncharacterized membrane protein
VAEPRRYRRAESRLDQPREPRRVRLPRLSGDTFGHFAEMFARFMGTARFIAYMTVFVLFWIALNAIGLFGLKWDPYPFILLNLFFRTQASYAAPLILLAQNRQADRDRLTMDEDRRRAAMQKADTEYLAREIASLRIALGEVTTRDFLRSELVRVIEELDEAAHRRHKLDHKEIRRAGRREQHRSDFEEPFDDLDADLGQPALGKPEEESPRASRG